MEAKPVIELYDFLVESELQQYYNAIKNELKITLVPHLKYASDEDLKQVGLSKPQIRRLRKFYEKYYPHGYLSKIKRLLQNPAGKREEVGTLNNASSTETLKTISSPSKLPSNKHIIPADSICVNKQLGVGEFGIVQQGVWTNGNERIQVAIKCLCRERMQSNPMEFLKEAAIMHSIEHENIVRLYGVVLDTDSLMLVTELAHLRSLLECLKDSGLRVSFLTVPTLCEFAQQICSGMMYLENKRLIHRDLAARNILVFSKTKVKISDFGLSRALGVGKDYYQTNFNVNLKLPIAWCAPECINFLRFTNASDVWAYGVCLWEMFSYGFQPWAALTGHQILEAIDEPHYQRLEQPECCPKEYYTLMLKCWQHDPAKRPKFAEIHTILPDMKPEQLKTVIAYGEAKKEHLMYRQNDIITVLDKPNNTTYWKGVLNSGKTGMFDPSNTVAYLGNSLPSSVNRDSFVRGSERTSSRRKLCPEMISGPQNDLKHTGHVGLDGAYFGDVAFLSSSNSQSYNHVPRQIVTPYKPSEDIEQTPLLPSTPTSPDSLQTASGYFAENNHTFLNAHSAQTNDGFNSSFDFSNQNSSTPVTASNAGFTSSNPFVNLDNSTHNKILSEGGGFTNILEEENFSKEHTGKNGMKWVGDATSAVADPTHEYHEISDDEMPGEKFDLGPSLLDEMDFMFRSMSANSEHGELKSPDFENNNKKNEIAELAAKFQRKNSGGLLPGSMSSLKTKKKSGNVPSGAGNVKPISTKDEKMLNQAIDFANEISARSMTDLVNDSTSTQSPKRKFSFRFPHLVHHSNNGDKDLAASPSSQHKGSHGFKTRNFSEEAQNVPDLQRFRSLSEIEKYHSIDMRYSHGERDPSFEYRYRKMREFSSRPFKFDISAPGMETDGGINDVNYNGLRGNYENSSSKVCTLSQKTKDFIGENLIDIENTLKALNLDFLQTFNDLEKNDSAETLFGENYTYDATNINPKILNKALKLSKIPTNYSSMEVSPKSTKSSQYSPLDKQAAQPQFHGSVHYLNESGSTDKLLDGKRSSTPDTGFASRETNTSSRRGSQKSSYSPQDTHFSPSYTTQIEEARAAYAHLKANGSFPSRQRSMSFTENYDLKSPVLSEPQFAKIHNSTTVGRTNSSDGQAVRRRHRNTISHKPKSIRARNLRRLSYNPIILDSSSSSNSENEFNHRSVENVRTIDSRRHHSYRSHRNSAASPIKSNDDIYDFKNWHTNSESDIRLKNRKTQAHFQSNISYTPSQDRLYGSNASIKSAPQYNNFACDRQMQNYLGRKMNYPHAQYNDYADQLKLAPSSSSHASNQTPINFERNAHRSSSRRRQQQQTLRNSYLLPPPPPPPSSNNRTYDLNAYSLFSQFDVSKLTGKSPTTQSFLQDAQSPSKFETKPLETKQLTATSNNSATSNTFQWPEKIHVSAVAAQNSNIMWPQKPSVQSLHTDFITEECREAYNSLVEKPAATLHRFNNVKLTSLKNSMQLSSSMSALQVPASKSTMTSTPSIPADNSLACAQPSITQNCTSELKMPSKPAPRPNTLPNRGSAPNKPIRTDLDTNPLHILRDKNYRIIRPRMKVNSIGMDPTSIDSSMPADPNSNQDDACESPSYLTNTQYTFSERDVNIHHNDTQKFIGNKEIENLNPIPLPPRDRNKVLLTNVKRHVRKHPLIIPASGLQRTLNKVTTPVEEKNPLAGLTTAINHDEIDGSAKSSSNSNKINYNMPRTSTKPAEVMKLTQYTSSWKKFIDKKFAEDECRTYENLDALRMQVDNTDSASLHFESILEGDINQVGDASQNSSGHNFLFESENYDIPRMNANAVVQKSVHDTEMASYENTNLNNDIERKRREFALKYPNYAQTKDELTDNALFNKFRSAADECIASSSVMTHSTITDDDISGDESNDELPEGKLKDSNSVSCEDLLEFANKKPKGRERGIESDEVRIMSKVLGTNTTPEQCIIALDFIEWNVHRAIKIISLQNALKPKRNITFEECVEALQKHDWDLHATSIKLGTN